MAVAYAPDEERSASQRPTDDLVELLVSNAEDHAIFMMDTGGFVKSWNPGAERLKGYRAEEIIGRNFSVLYPDEDAATGKPARHLAIAAAEGRLEDEGWRVRRNGTRFWANVVLTALRDPDGALRGYGKITRDISDRHNDELALRASEERFRLMVDGVQDYAILILDAEGRVETWNSGAERMKGYRADEIVGRHLSIFYPAEDVAAGKPERELATAALEGRLEDEGWRVRQNGTLFWANFVITALRDPSGALRGYGKITRDLTVRRAAELALGTSEQRFRRSFDEAAIGMVIIGIDGRYERVNDAFCAFVGYSREQMAGLSRESITHPDDAAADAELQRALLAGVATSFVSEKRHRHASGRTVWGSVSIALIRDPDGRPLHYIAQVQDITERRRNEHLLAHIADHDALTGLLNRRGFERELTSHMARVARYGASGALLMLDLDNFKCFNDTHGHSAGDELIVKIAQALKARLRESDALARLGGDEFAVLIPSGDELATQHVAATLLQTVRDLTVPSPIGRSKWVTGSVGVARFDDNAHPVAEEIMIKADLAMYAAKKAGGNRWLSSLTGEHGGPKTRSRAKAKPRKSTKPASKKVVSPSADVP